MPSGVVRNGVVKTPTRIRTVMKRAVAWKFLLPLLLTGLAMTHFTSASEIDSLSTRAGDASRLMQEPQVLRWAIDLFFTGSLLMMGGYHVVFYRFRRGNAATLYFGAYCLIWAFNFLVTYGANSALSLFLPDIPGELLQRAEQVSFLATIPVGYLFFKARFPEDFPKWIYRPLSLLYGAFIVLALVVPLPLMLRTNLLTYPASFVMIVLTLVFLLRAWRARREGAGISLIGFAILGCIASNDMLHDLKLIDTIYLMPLGMSLFIFAQSSALSLSFSRAFSSVEKLSSDLESKNTALHQEMGESARLEAEIVNLSENERRHLSHELHDGLCQQITAARMYCDMLRDDMRAHPEGKRIAHLSALLTDSVNQAYNLSRGLWPVDLDPIGMSVSLEAFCNRVALSKGIAVNIEQRRSCPECRNENIAQLYRIAQEAITNAAKHSGASLIQVSLNCARESGAACTVALSVRDNGVGRRSAAHTTGGLGTRIMMHRARIIGGELEISDIDNGGTEVRCQIQCTQQENDSPRTS